MQIEISNLQFSYGSLIALQIEELKIEASSRVMVLGENAAGKTTLFKLLTANLKPASGTVKFDAAEINSFSSLELAKIIAYLPQQKIINNLYTVKDLFDFSSEVIKQNYQNQYPLAHLINSKLEQLSGGQQQLAFLYASLFQAQKILILDEPFLSLDAKQTTAAKNSIIEDSTNRKLTLLLSNHSNLISLAGFTHYLAIKNGKVHSYDHANSFNAEIAAELFECQAQKILINNQEYIVLL